MDGRGFSDAELGADVSAQQDQTRRLVRAMMRITDQTASALARAAGLTPSTVNRFMHQAVRHTLSQRTLLALMIVTFDHLKARPRDSIDRNALAELARAVPVFERALVGHDPENRELIASLKPGEQAQPATKPNDDIAVVTAGAVGVDPVNGNFRGAMLRTPRPPFLASDERGFAVLMPDASMTPRFEPGDLLYVSPGRNAFDAGVDVLALLPIGGFLVGRLSIDGSGRRVVPLNGLRSIAADQCAAIYRIVGSHRP